MAIRPDNERKLLLADLDRDDWVETLRAAQTPPTLGKIGPYEIIEEINRGGQGVVYRAVQPVSEKPIALKRLHSGIFAGDDARRRFADEIRAIARFDHPNLVRVLDVAVIDQQPILVMEWVDGVPIDQWARGSNKSPRGIAGVFATICDAVHHAHQRGVIHRDLKPSNILIDRSDQPRVLDFGVAKSLLREADTNATTGFFGTPAYAAPEQLRNGNEVDVRGDVYSLGVVLYEVLTGKRPFGGEQSLLETLEAVERADVSPPSRYRGALRGEFDAVILKAIARDPARRYQSMEAFAHDLRQLRDGKEVAALAPDWRYRTRKFVARHWLATSGAVLALFVVAAFLLFAQIKNERIRAEREAANATSAFLADLLSAAKPGNQGVDATVLDLLADAEQRVATELADNPRATADVLFTIGSTYRSLWHWQEATAPLEQAVAIMRAEYPPQHEKLARALAELGTVYTSRRDERAVPTQREALAMRRALSGERDALTALAEKSLGYALYQVERKFREAETHLQRAVDLYDEIYDAPHRDIGSCLHNFAYMYVTERRYPKADAMFARAVAAFRALDDPNEPYFAECLYGYSFLLAAREKWSTARDVAAEAIPLISRHFGTERTIPLLGILSRVEAELGNCDAARAASMRGFAAVCSQIAADDDVIAVEQLHAWIADASRLAGSAEYSRLVEIVDGFDGSGARRLLNQVDNLAMLLAICGDDAAAAVLWDCVRSHDALRASESHPLLIHAHEGLGLIAQRAGRLDDAESMLRQALAYADATQRVHPPTRLRVVGALAICLQAAGDDDAARACAEEALTALRAMHSGELGMIRALEGILE